MRPGTAPDDEMATPNEVEFFGVKLKVRNPHLAALLNSSVHEDVQVIGRRARDVFGGDDVRGGVETDDARAERQVELRLNGEEAPVELRPLGAAGRGGSPGDDADAR